MRNEQRLVLQIVVGLFVAAVDGIVFCFSLLVPALKAAPFYFGESQIGTIAGIVNVAGFFSMPAGFSYDHLGGPRPTLLIGVLIMGTSWILLSTAVFGKTESDFELSEHGQPKMSILPLVIALFSLAMMSSTFIESSVMLSAFDALRLNHGFVIVTYKSFIGLGGAVISLVFAGFFTTDDESQRAMLAGRFSLFVGLFGSVVCVFGFFFTSVPPAASGPQPPGAEWSFLSRWWDVRVLGANMLPAETAAPSSFSSSARESGFGAAGDDHSDNHNKPEQEKQRLLQNQQHRQQQKLRDEQEQRQHQQQQLQSRLEAKARFRPVVSAGYKLLFFSVVFVTISSILELFAGENIPKVAYAVIATISGALPLIFLYLLRVVPPASTTTIVAAASSPSAAREAVAMNSLPHAGAGGDTSAVSMPAIDRCAYGSAASGNDRAMPSSSASTSTSSASKKSASDDVLSHGLLSRNNNCAHGGDDASAAGDDKKKKQEQFSGALSSSLGAKLTYQERFVRALEGMIHESKTMETSWRPLVDFEDEYEENVAMCRETIFQNMCKRPLELLLLWGLCFGLWGSSTMIYSNVASLYSALQGDYTFSTARNAVFVAIFGVGNAVGRAIAGLMLPLLQGRAQTVWQLLRVSPVTLILGLLLFVVARGAALLLGFLFCGLATGFSWGITICVAKRLFANSGQSYSFLYTAAIAGVLFFVLFLFPYEYNRHAELQAQERNTVTSDNISSTTTTASMTTSMTTTSMNESVSPSNSSSGGSQQKHCRGFECVELSLYIVILFNALAIVCAEIFIRRVDAGAMDSGLSPLPDTAQVIVEEFVVARQPGEENDSGGGIKAAHALGTVSAAAPAQSSVRNEHEASVRNAYSDTHAET